MIVCDNTIAGFKGIVGTVSIHIGMLITMFWVPHNFDENSKYAELNDLWFYCFFMHIALTIVCGLNIFVRSWTRMAAKIFTILGMSIYIALYLVLVINLTKNW